MSIAVVNTHALLVFGSISVVISLLAAIAVVCVVMGLITDLSAIRQPRRKPVDRGVAWKSRGIYVRNQGR